MKIENKHGKLLSRPEWQQQQLEERALFGQMNGKYVSEESSMCFPLKQMILKRIISLNQSPFARPYIEGLICASSINIFNLTIGRDRLETVAEAPRPYEYFQIASSKNDLQMEELKLLTGRLASNTGRCIFDCGVDVSLDDNILSVFAVSYSGALYIRKQKEMPDNADELERLLHKGRSLVHGYNKDEQGNTIIDTDQGYLAFSHAAEMGSAEAQAELGVRYAAGIDCDKDLEKARELLQKAATSTESRWSCMAMAYAMKEGIHIKI